MRRNKQTERKGMADPADKSLSVPRKDWEQLGDLQLKQTGQDLK